MLLIAALAGFVHETVLAEPAVDALAVRAEGVYVDVTAGGGGHSRRIAERLGPSGRLLALDRDPAAVLVARARLHEDLARRPEGQRPLVEVVHAPFASLASVLAARGIDAVDGLLADLGVSSPQLDGADRGFSFRHDGALDMRMDPTTGPTAADLVNSLPEEELSRALFSLGGESDARRVARAIVARRTHAPFTRTGELALVIEGSKGRRKPGAIHPATKAFQALRILVNGEDHELERLLVDGFAALRPGGRLAIITFHSGEDRPVKRALAAWARGPELPPAQAVFERHGKPVATLIHGGGLAPDDAEVARNPRARSARLRVVEKLR